MYNQNQLVSLRALHFLKYRISWLEVQLAIIFIIDYQLFSWIICYYFSIYNVRK